MMLSRQFTAEDAEDAEDGSNEDSRSSRPLRPPRPLRLQSSLIVILISLGLTSCRSEHPLFELLTAKQTGITFANTITTTDSLNVLTDPYVYNGAGVAVG